jgi:hypothetical protein
MYRIELSPIDLAAVHEADSVATEAYHHRANAASPWQESLMMRLVAGAALFAIPLFVYFLMSLPNPLQPAFTTTEVVLALVLLGLVISRR